MATTNAKLRDPLADLERYRSQLEQHLHALQKSLRHWQTWEAEYEGLKEEIEGFKGEPTSEDMIAIGRDFDSDLVNEKEVRELLGFGKGVDRNAKQVISAISRRIDYVQRNVSTLQKQLEAAENKLKTVLVVSSPDLGDENGLPLMDIREELDEEGNVTSSSITRPGEKTEELAEVLRKAGITDIKERPDAESVPAKSLNESNRRPSDATKQREDSAELPDEQDSSSTPTANRQGKPVESSKLPAQEASRDRQLPPEPKATERPAAKSVSFASDAKVKDGPLNKRKPKSTVDDDFVRGTFPKGTRVIEVDDNDQVIGVTPTDESPEDVALRREMLEYAMDEVGPVVAEIDLEDPDDPFSSDDNVEGDYGSSYDDDDEEENEWGMSTRSQITPEYRQRMTELEKKLDAMMLENVGPRSENTLTHYSDDLRRLVVRADDGIDGKIEENAKAPKADELNGPTPKKGVRFAEELDISPAPKPAEPSTQSRPFVSPVASIIKEHGTDNTASVPEPPKPRKLSRFKSARAGNVLSSVDEHTLGRPASAPPLTKIPQGPIHLQQDQPAQKVTPEGPGGRTLASRIVERAVSPNKVAEPDPDGLDPALLQREVAMQYHTMRNKLIQEQGGFMPSPEAEADPLMEEKDGKIRKVSRFKAARLGESKQ